MGVMWLVSGITWLGREDPTGYMVNALHVVLENEAPFAFYETFIQQTVLPNKNIFSTLVSFGELSVGLSLLSGTMVKIGATGALFLLLNYASMNGDLFSPFGLLFIGIHVLILLSKPGRVIGVDKLLHQKWPTSKLF